MENSLSDIRLNEQQLIMLRLLREPMPEEYFDQLRRMTVQFLARKIDEKIDKWEKENNIDAEYYEIISKQHFRSKKKNDE